MNSRHLLVLALAALAVYVPASNWGIPHATDADRMRPWGIDDEAPMGPLAEVSHILREPAPDRNLGYPLMHPFTVAAAYTPYMGYLFVTGRFSAPGSEYPFGFEDPIGTLWTLSMIAHLVSVLFAVLTVLAAYAAATFLWNQRTGLLAAAFTLTSYPMFFYGRTANVDAMMIGFMALCLASFAYWLRHPDQLRGMIGIGIFGGFSLATKEPIFPVFLPIPFVVLWIMAKDGLRLGEWSWWRQPVLGVVSLFGAFGIGSGLFVEPSRFFAHVRFVTGRVGEAAAGEVPFTVVYPNTLEGNIGLIGSFLAYIVDSLTLPGTLLAVVGVVLAFRMDRSSAVLAVSSVVYVVVLFLTARIGFIRYLMPAAFPLGLYAALAVSRGWDSQKAWARYSLVGLGVISLGLGALRGVDLTHAMLNDSRYAAGEWLAENSADGQRLEYFGTTQKLPWLPASMGIQRATPYLGGIVVHPRDAATAAEIGAGWAERRPDFVVAMPDFTSEPGEPHSHSHPPDAFAGLMDGRYGYTLAATFETERLLPWVRSPELDYWLVNPPIRIFVPGAP